MSAGLADQMIFFPPPPSYDGQGEGFVRLETAAGDTISAYHRRSAARGVTVLFAHGNAEDIGDGQAHADRYAQLGVSVLAFDYPGYGLSTGRPSEEGAYRAADAAYRYLVDQQGVAPEAVLAHGRSLGGGVVADLASRERVGGLVLESTFVSAYRVVTRLPVFPVDQFTSLSKLRSVEAPVLIIHGEEDEVIAPWHGRRLFAAVDPERRYALWVRGAGHNDLASVAGDRYWTALEDFVHVVAGTRKGSP